MALAPYIFGAGTNIRTPQEAAHLRAVAEALASQGRTPHTIGEGLSAIGDAIASRRYRMRGDRMESEGRAAYQSKYGDLVKSLISGNGAAVAPVPTADAPGGEPPQSDLSQARPEYLTGGGMPPPPTMENVANAQLPPLESDASISSYSPPNDPAAAAGQPVQTAGLSITGSDLPQAEPQQPGVQQVAANGFDPRLIDALSDPWIPDGQKAVLEELFKQQLKKNEPPDYGFTTQGTDIYRTNPRTGQVERVIDNPDKPENPPADVQNYEYAVRGGFKGTFEDWTKLKDPMVQVNTGDTGSGDKELRKSLGTEEGKRWDAIQQAGTVSGSMAQDFQVLDQLMTVAPQSPLTGPFLQMFPGLSTTGAAFQSIVTRIAPSLRTPGSGSTSDIEYEGMLQSLPRLSNYPESNQLIAEVMKGKAALNVERSDVITAYQNDEITSKEARSKLAELNKRSILSPKMKALLNAQGAKAASEMTDEELLQQLGVGGQ
jgi:hypothetical protein